MTKPEEESRGVESGSANSPTGSTATGNETAASDSKPRIWAVHCPFRKNGGGPVVGTFGAAVNPVVIMRMETWTRLCKEIPELGRRQFEVGNYE